MPDTPVTVSVTATDDATGPLLDIFLDTIRAEYMRGIPDAYACGPRARERTWQRLKDMIEAYADACVAAKTPTTVRLLAESRAASADWNRKHFEEPAEATVAPSDPAPTMSPAPEPSADTGRVDGGEAPQEPASKPGRGRKRTTPAQPAPTTPETESGEDATP